MKKKTTVIIADDHPLFRSGVRQALEKEEQFTILGEAADGERALQLIRDHKPELAVLDINMPRMSGLHVAKELTKEKQPPAVVLLTMFDDDEILNEAMDIGVKGYLLKESASIDIADAAHAAVEGRHFVSPTLTDKLLKRRDLHVSFAARNPGLEALSPAERKVLKLISESKTSKQIADELFLSPKTVENYRFRISEKLNVRGSYSLLKFALENKSLL